ncbi:DUF4352 domain-containing protein [Thermosphaera chiliense]|uniref:DUF4352 domain-containing protein n=1 Tax=Thermosphaera chiliense TaxID=3402707 RepID=A0A7M1UQW6_9CREN|nr:DUF4352 domain-containing protein [Thermosphaera aggregans]QOR94640.1 DUF4352 domain-containing protein [Thermosphaera aggregans]
MQSRDLLIIIAVAVIASVATASLFSIATKTTVTETVTNTATVYTPVTIWMTTTLSTTTTVYIPVDSCSENLQITYAYATVVQGGWRIELKVENKGTSTAIIDTIFVNGVPYTGVNLPISLEAGKNTIITITLQQGQFNSGQQVEIKLHTASGKEYPKMVTLP